MSLETWTVLIHLTEQYTCSEGKKEAEILEKSLCYLKPHNSPKFSFTPFCHHRTGPTLKTQDRKQGRV